MGDIKGYDGFGKVADAIDAAGLASTLDGGEYTVFGPVDSAVKGDLSADVLKYHVVPGKSRREVSVLTFPPSMAKLSHTRGLLVKHSSMMQSLAHRVRVQQLAQCTLSMLLSTAVLFTPLTSLLFQDGLKWMLRQVLVVLHKVPHYCIKYHTI